MKNSPLKIVLELTQLEARRVELEKELENVKAAFDHHKSNWLKYLMPLSRRNKNCWPRSEKAGPSIVALRIFLDQPKRISNKSWKSTLSG